MNHIWPSRGDETPPTVVIPEESPAADPEALEKLIAMQRSMRKPGLDLHLVDETVIFPAFPTYVGKHRRLDVGQD